MTDVVCFSCGLEFADKFLAALKRDFYTQSNILASGEPFFVKREGDALFFCPVVLPIGGVVGRTVLKTVFRGFASSAKKGGFSLSRVKFSKDLEVLFDEYKESLSS